MAWPLLTASGMAISTPHATTGTARRAAHVLSGQGLLYSLRTEANELKADLQRATGGRAAKTLAKAGGLRSTLVLIQRGHTLQPEASRGGATIQVIEGELTVRDGEDIHVGPGDLVVLGSNLHEPITAEQDTLFLVTVAWPEGAGAWEQEVQAGRL